MLGLLSHFLGPIRCGDGIDLRGVVNDLSLKVDRAATLRPPTAGQKPTPAEVGTAAALQRDEVKLVAERQNLPQGVQKVVDKLTGSLDRIEAAMNHGKPIAEADLAAFRAAAKELGRLLQPQHLFFENSKEFIEDKVVTNRQAMIFYTNMAAEAATDPTKKEQFEEFQHNAGPIATKEFVPISFISNDGNAAFHDPLVGGRTAQGSYRLVDPMTNRYYEGSDKAAALQQFLANSKYPEGIIRYPSAAGPPGIHNVPPQGHSMDTSMMIWSGVAVAAMLGSLAFPAALPATGPAGYAALSGMVPGIYFADQGAQDINDRLKHGQHVSKTQWVLEGTQVAALALGIGSVAAASRMTSNTMSVVQRAAALQRYLVMANVANDTLAAGAMTKQLWDVCRQPGVTDKEKLAAVFQTFATIALSTGANYHNVGGLKGYQRLAEMGPAEFEIFAKLPQAQRLATLQLSDPDYNKIFRPPLGPRHAVIDTQTALALNIREIDPSQLDPGHKALLAQFDKMVSSGKIDPHDIRVADTTAGEIKTGKVNWKRFEVQVDRSSPQYKAVLQALEKYAVGAKKGTADRQIIADAFFAQAEPGVKPTVMTQDKKVYNKLLLMAGQDPAKLGKDTIFSRYPDGFDLTIEGRTIHIVPLSGK